eukprot:jgi/Picre1/27415/NNA_000382.t1
MSKRQFDGGSRRESRGKRKKWFDSSKVKGIPKGSRGVLVSCILGQEKKAGREALAILSESFEALKNSHGSKKSDESKEKGDGNDISSLLADEIADLKDKDKQDFSIREVGISALVYIECKYEDGPQPSDIVMHALETAKETGRTRHGSAIDSTLLITHHPPNWMISKTWGRSLLKNTFLRAMPPYKVDLNNPDKTVLVNVIKGTCGAAVVQKYRALSKFNLRELTLSSACNEKDGD